MEQEQGMDPDVKRFFKNILNTISLGLLWLLSVTTAGIYFRLGWQGDKPLLYVILFYTLAAATFGFLLRYYYSIWKK